MGYRNYIGSISKREYNKIKKMSREELFMYKNPEKEIDPDDFYIGAYDLVKELYEFGKYVEFGDKKFFKPFFKNKETFNYYDGDQEFYIVQKEFLEHIINWYREKITAYYQDMVNPFFTEKSDFLESIKTEYGFEDNKYTFDFSKITLDEQTALFKIIDHVKSFGQEWGVKTFRDFKPYDLDGDESITTSWKYEYGIFELVRIYKTFDWKKNIMVWYGW